MFLASESKIQNVFLPFISNDGVRSAFEKFVGNSLQETHRVAPNSWSITLNEKMFRINVGRIEVITLTKVGVGIGVALDLDQNDCPILPDYLADVLRFIQQTQTLIYSNGNGNFEFYFVDGYPSVPEHCRIDIENHLRFDDFAFIWPLHEKVLTAASKRFKSTQYKKNYNPLVINYLIQQGYPVEHPAYYSPLVMDNIGVLQNFKEGKSSRTESLRKERNPTARRACLEYYGYKCYACGVDLGSLYGLEFRDAIQVHHLEPLCEIVNEREINPVEGLRPLCPNCHAIAHRRKKPYSIEELRRFLQHND